MSSAPASSYTLHPYTLTPYTLHATRYTLIHYTLHPFLPEQGYELGPGKVPPSF